MLIEASGAAVTWIMKLPVCINDYFLHLTLSELETDSEYKTVQDDFHYKGLSCSIEVLRTFAFVARRMSKLLSFLHDCALRLCTSSRLTSQIVEKVSGELPW